MRRRSSSQCCRSDRHGFTQSELLVVLFFVAIVVGLCLPAVLRVREASARTQSQSNLKCFGVAINSYAAAYNDCLPNAGGNARYWFCGTTETDDGAGPSPAPTFLRGILSQMAGFMSLVAPLDINATGTDPFACSYSIPASWATLADGTGDLRFPRSFLRGTSQCIGVAEMTTFGVTYNGITPFSDAAYMPAVAGKASTTANNFSKSGCQVAMLDGSVKNVFPAANAAVDWTIACHPDDTTSRFTTNW